MTERLNQIYIALLADGMKKTAIAKKIGFTTTSQLHSVLSGKGMLSSRAILSIVTTLKVSPNFLLLGTGTMFCSGLENDTEISLRELTEKNKELENANMLLINKNEKLEKIIDKLL